MSDAATKIFIRPYALGGASEPNGWSYCLRMCNGDCVAHGIVFGGIENIFAEVPKLVRNSPVIQDRLEIFDLYTCHDEGYRKGKMVKERWQEWKKIREAKLEAIRAARSKTPNLRIAEARQSRHKKESHV